MAKILHVLWSPQTGPFVGYFNPQVAWGHARTMLGVEVAQVEIREQMPDVAREDIQVEWDGEDDTPRVIDIELDAIPDAIIRDGKKRSDSEG